MSQQQQLIYCFCKWILDRLNEETNWGSVSAHEEDIEIKILSTISDWQLHS